MQGEPGGKQQLGNDGDRQSDGHKDGQHSHGRWAEQERLWAVSALTAVSCPLSLGVRKRRGDHLLEATYGGSS